MKKYNITVNGTTYEVLVEEVPADNTVPAPAAPTTVVQKSVAKTAAAPATAGVDKITTPMPGTILDVKVSVGQSIKKGDVLFVLEAMKMENDIPAPRDGVIASIDVSKGANVQTGDLLATLN